MKKNEILSNFYLLIIHPIFYYLINSYILYASIMLYNMMDPRLFISYFIYKNSIININKKSVFYIISEFYL